MSDRASTFGPMDFVDSLGGRPFKVDGDRIWSKSGQYVGKVVEGRVFSSNGLYLGEFRDHRLASKRSTPARAARGTSRGRIALVRPEATARLGPYTPAGRSSTARW